MNLKTRSYENALWKVMGATRLDLSLTLLVEFGAHHSFRGASGFFQRLGPGPDREHVLVGPPGAYGFGRRGPDRRGLHHGHPAALPGAKFENIPFEHQETVWRVCNETITSLGRVLAGKDHPVCGADKKAVIKRHFPGPGREKICQKAVIAMSGFKSSRNMIRLAVVLAVLCGLLAGQARAEYPCELRKEDFKYAGLTDAAQAEIKTAIEKLVSDLVNEADLSRISSVAVMDAKGPLLRRHRVFHLCDQPDPHGPDLHR